MPLFIGSQRVQNVPSSVAEFMKEYPQLPVAADKLKSKPVQTVPATSLLFVFQRQYAVLGPDYEKITCTGSQDATTCHMLVLRNSGSGITAFAHCDGTKTDMVVASMINDITKLSVGKPDGRIKCTIAGGFVDSRGISEMISKEILQALIASEKDIDLVTACITDMNTTIKNGVNFPVIYGICAEIGTGNIFPATFPDKGPDEGIRLAPPLAHCEEFLNCYDYDKRQLLVGPYHWKPQPQLKKYLDMSNEEIRKELSTSPEQEAPGFAANTKLAIRTIVDNPDPVKSLFPGDQARRYEMTSPGQWTRVGQASKK